MFGKLMNRYYYGKSGQGDFTKDDLPRNRWQLFWAMLRVRLAGLCRLNLMYLVVMLPTVIVIGRGLLYLYQGLNIAAGFEAGQISEAEAVVTFANFTEFSQTVIMQTLLLLIPAFAITGPFTCGMAYVCRNWARDEHAFVWMDFKDAIKANWKQGLGISVISAIAPVLVYFTCTVYSQLARGGNVIMYVPLAVIIMMGAVWAMMSIYLYPLAVTYDLKFRGLLHNALFLAIGRLPQSLGLRLISLVPHAFFFGIALLLGNNLIYAVLVWILYYVFIGFAFIRFVYASYSNAVFDRYINSRIEGVETNRGLYREDEDDEDESENEDSKE